MNQLKKSLDTIAEQYTIHQRQVYMKYNEIEIKLSFDKHYMNEPTERRQQEALIRTTRFYEVYHRKKIV